MKKFLAVLALTLLSIIPARAQSGSTTITIVAAPALGTVTPTPTHFYQNTAAPISFASSTNGFSSGCTATVGAGSTLPVTYSSTTNALTATLTAAMTSGAVGSTLTISINCTPAPLTMLSPVTLPNASVGKSYSANLASLASLAGGIPPYSFSLTTGSLPPGLSLASSGVISGVASSAFSSNFTYTVKDSSGAALSIIKYNGCREFPCFSTDRTAEQQKNPVYAWIESN